MLLALVLGISSSIPAQSPKPDLSSQFRQAYNLAQHQQPDQALTLTRRILAENPDYVPALKLQGMLLEDAGKTVEAASSYRKALQLAPHDPDLLYKVGVDELTSGNPSKASALLQEYLRFEPKEVDALYYLAQAEHLAGHDDLALKAIRQAVQYQPANAAVLQKYGELLVSSGDSESGYDWLLKADRANPDLQRIDFDLGVACLNKMDFQCAEQSANKAIAQQPGNIEALQLLAAAQMKLAEWPAALDSFQHILALKENDRDALLGLGRCQLELKQNPAAVDTLNHLLQNDPADILAHYYLSRAYAALGNATEAQHQADLHHRMMEQSSFSASALGTEEDKAVWAQARTLIEQGHEAAALKIFEDRNKGPSASPGHPYFLIGALYLYIGDPVNGLRNLHRALQIDPKVRGAHTYLGIYDLQQSHLTDAEQEFQSELANDPNYETAIAELGLVRYKLERWSEAAQDLSRSHTRTPALLLALADAYFHLGKIKDADLTAEIAAAYARDDQELMDNLFALLNRNGQTDLARRLSGSAR